MKKNQNLEAETVLSDHRTCNTGKQGCISPIAQGGAIHPNYQKETVQWSRDETGLGFWSQFTA